MIWHSNFLTHKEWRNKIKKTHKIWWLSLLDWCPLMEPQKSLIASKKAQASTSFERSTSYLFGSREQRACMTFNCTFRGSKYPQNTSLNANRLGIIIPYCMFISPWHNFPLLIHKGISPILTRLCNIHKAWESKRMNETLLDFSL